MRDYFYWLGGMLTGGCGSEPPPYQSWILPGWRSGRLQSGGAVVGGYQYFLPLVMARSKRLEEAAVNVLAIPGIAGSVSIRAAIYSSRGNRCAYPGARLFDLGETTRITPGVAGFFLPGDVDLEGGNVYWVGQWWELTTSTPLITTNATAEAGAYPILGYAGPTDLTPRCGWVRARPYQSPGLENWPNPAPTDLLTLTIGGQITAPPTTLGLAAVYMRFSAPL